MHTKKLLESLRARHPAVKSAEPVAVLGMVGKEVRVDRSGGNRDIVIVGTTEDIDLIGDVVVASGGDLSYLKANRSIFVDHAQDTPGCVAKLRSAAPYPSINDFRGWLFRLRVLELKGNPLCDDILTIAEEGGIGASIGIVPTDQGPPTPLEVKLFSQNGEPPLNVIRKWKMLELSLTAFPMNVNCQSVQVVSSDTEKRLSLLDELVMKGRIQRQSADALKAGPVLARPRPTLAYRPIA